VRPAVPSFRRPFPALLLAGALALVLIGEAGADDGPGANGAVLDPAAAASLLPAETAFDGTRSIKHVRLTGLVYRTMKELDRPRVLAIACWSPAGWAALARAEGEQLSTNGALLQGLWLARQPRWLHLSSDVCTDLQRLTDSRRPNARRADALAVLIHEALHAHGYANEAQANCYAVQLVPEFARTLKVRTVSADYLAKLARTITRSHAPRGYWNETSCRDGGRWDLVPDRRNLD
jgi:hypothetical protein